MPKLSTRSIQDSIAEFGRTLGFHVETETGLLGRTPDEYCPVPDVAWYLDTRGLFSARALRPVLKGGPEWIDHLEMLPIAGFEIEGSTTTSKNQLGNLSNLYAAPFLFKFAVVNNSAATTEKDTYRRGVKICNYFRDAFGYQNVFLLDWCHLSPTLDGLTAPQTLQVTARPYPNATLSRRGSGGETASVGPFNDLLPCFVESGLYLQQDYAPEPIRWQGIRDEFVYGLLESRDEQVDVAFRKRGTYDPVERTSRALSRPADGYYIPKLDLMAGLPAPRTFVDWLRAISLQLGPEVVNHPLLLSLKLGKVSEILLPLVAVEVETSISKHLNGGIVNLARNSFCGVLAAGPEAERHLNFFRRRLACNNVVHHVI
jgi:hypothetical protein